MKIHDYVRKGNIKEVSRLINQKDVYIDCVDKDNSYKTPLMIAVINPDIDIDMVRFLVENGADIDAVGGNNQSRIIDLAIQAGSQDKIRFLLDAGADINYRNSDSYDILINAMYGRDIKQDENLLPILNLLIEKGVEVSSVSSYGESALKVAYGHGRFDVVKLLLDAGADEKQLHWTYLIETVAFGTVEEVKILLEAGADIYHLDCWNRNAFFLSLETGDLEKAKVLLSFTPSRDDSSFWWKSPLFYPIKYNYHEILKWLILEGFDIEETDEYLNTPLMEAAESGAIDCVRILLEAGADTSKVDDLNESAIKKAANLEVFKMLVSGSEDLSDISDEIRILLLGVADEESIEEIKHTKDKTAKFPRFGIKNPEIIENEFWEAMIRSGDAAYTSRSDNDSLNNPIWCYQRFGRTTTILPDERIIEIAGEHEDFYDPDFCIYNDVVVFDGKGNFQIYGYPSDVFPPTDFHSATLVDNYIYIIGNLGYKSQRIINETPVYRLDCDSFQIQKIKTIGDKPGWISRHKAKFQPPSQICISGGQLWKIVDSKKDLVDNTLDYILNLNNFEWNCTNF
ncbi:ankyrin [Calothrix parasitica NIES-267]|uniref:Ankyrin n=1 Tax=Calothrix parasitica NIES-267 TaxID=1973488 RepID=A0A1Z4LYE8_9CYAN|nr:ankyrin [Calothrix parasitica NIES-267]